MKTRLLPFLLLALFNLCWQQPIYAQIDTVKLIQTFNRLEGVVNLDNRFSYPALLRFNNLLNKELRREHHKFYDRYKAKYDSLHATFVRDHAYLRYVPDDQSIYSEMQRSWRANQIVNYGTPGAYVHSIGNRRVPLMQGEGSKDFNLLEANLNHQFTLNMGRPQAPAWRRRMRTTFDYGVNFRMTTDDSNPIVPYSNHVGLSVESVVFDTFYGNIFKDKSRYEKTTYADIQDSVKKHSFVSVQLQAHHYSNGQDGDAEYVDPLGTRNNYRTGNFSTNYWRLRVAHSTVNLKKHSLFTAALGFRKDGSVGSVLNYDENQRMAYGYYRIEYLFDWYSAVHETRDFFTNRLDKWQHHLRINGDFIADKDLSNFTPNLTGKENNKFRLGVNALIEIRPLSYRTIGYLVRAYVGRDYLNIRYDDIIFTIQTGLTLTLDKYYPSGWYPEGDNLKIKKLPPRKMFRRVKS